MLVSPLTAPEVMEQYMAYSPPNLDMPKIRKRSYSQLFVRVS